MEFYAEITSDLDPATIQRDITISNLPSVCDAIDKIIKVQGELGTIYCLWGEFDIRREAIQQGVRFTLPKCPNALAWTITKDPANHQAPVVVHCTINRDEHDPDFIESIEYFTQSWQTGLAELNP